MPFKSINCNHAPNSHAALALKGRNVKAEGNALGQHYNRNFKP